MSDKLRKAVQLVLALHHDPTNQWVRLDDKAREQLLAALDEPEFPWDDEDIEVTMTWSSGDGGEETVMLSPAGVIELIKHGRRSVDGDDGQRIDVTCLTIFTHVAPPDPEFTPAEIDTAADIAILRALQHAANGLNYHQFCDALGWPEDDYTKSKFKAYQSLGQLGVFDNETLLKPIRYYRLLNDVRRAP